MKNMFFTMLVLLAGVAISSPIKSNIACRETATTIEASGPTAKDYVQDGLLAMHDGEFNDIDNDGKYFHNPEARIWKDLSGNGYNAVCGSIGPLWGNKYTEIATNTTVTGTTYQKGIWFVNNVYKTMYPKMTNKGYTIEFVGLVTSKRQDSIVYLQSFSYTSLGSTWNGSYIAYFIDPSSNYWDGKSTTGAPTSRDSGSSYAIRGKVNGIANQIICYSVSVDFAREKTIIYCNGEMVAEYDWAALTGNSYSRFCYIPLKSNYAGNRCYCARVYEKPLSKEEIQSNYNIDKARFGL